MKMQPSDHYRQLEAEIWEGEDEVVDEVDGTNPHPVVAGINTLREAVADMSSAHGKNAETLQRVVTDIMHVITQSHAQMGDAAKASDEKMTTAFAAIKSALEKDADKTRKAILGLSGVISSLSGRLDAMAASMTAPRTLVMDEEGRPVGVRIETQ